MSEMIVSKPFLRGTKRFRRGEPAPTDLDKPTLNEYLRMGLVAPKKASMPAPSNTKPAAQPGTGATPGPRKREPAAPKEVKTVANAPPAILNDTGNALVTTPLGDSGSDAGGEGSGPVLPADDAGSVSVAPTASGEA